MKNVLKIVLLTLSINYIACGSGELPVYGVYSETYSKPVWQALQNHFGFSPKLRTIGWECPDDKCDIFVYVQTSEGFVRPNTCENVLYEYMHFFIYEATGNVDYLMQNEAWGLYSNLCEKIDTYGNLWNQEPAFQ